MLLICQNRILLLLVFIVFLSCKEVPPAIDLTPIDTSLIDTTYMESTIESPNDKMVLIEEFTGAKCVNCPQGHIKAEQLANSNPGRVAILSIHSGFFAVPIDDLSKEDYNTPDGNNIESLLGGASFWPAAAINRKKFPSETDIILSLSKWDGYVNAELLLNSFVNIDITNTLDEVKRELTVLVKLHYTSSITSTNKLNIAIIESQIVDAQMTPTGIDTFYVHNKVLRKLVTPYTGVELLPQSKLAGRVIIKEYKVSNIPANWNLNNCKTVAFVHEETNGELNIFNAAEKSFK